MAWFIAGIIAAPILWFIFKYMLSVVVGATAPPEVSGKQLLKQELRKLGVNSTILPEACLDEFVDLSKDVAEWTKDTLHHGHFSTAFVNNLEGTAINIARCLYVTETGSTMDSRQETENNYCYDILLRHGVVQVSS